MNQRGLPLPKEGWTYCPKCDADNMLATESGKQFDCPICGLVLQATSMKGEMVALVAIPPLELEVLIRYQVYLTRELKKRFETEQAELLKIKMPRRVKLAIMLMNVIGWCFRCECRVIHDKTQGVRSKEE